MAFISPHLCWGRLQKASSPDFADPAGPEKRLSAWALPQRAPFRVHLDYVITRLQKPPARAGGGARKGSQGYLEAETDSPCSEHRGKAQAVGKLGRNRDEGKACPVGSAADCSTAWPPFADHLREALPSSTLEGVATANRGWETVPDAQSRMPKQEPGSQREPATGKPRLGSPHCMVGPFSARC